MVATRIVIQFLLTVFTIDFVSGLVHWFEDAYGREDFPITGRLITKPNILHHHDPRYFTRNGYWHSNWDLICVSILGLLIARLIGLLTWEAWGLAILGANANQIHKWAHCTPRENGRIITFLQRCRILQSPRHHARHHTDPKNSHYCVITDFLNPLLDGIRFWDRLEFFLLHAFGMRRRTDKSIGHPMPDPPADERASLQNA